MFALRRIIKNKGMKKITINLVLIFSASLAYSQAVTFNYTGAMQSYTVPACATQITIDVKGGQGNWSVNGTNNGGKGGRVTGSMAVVGGQVLQIYVGGGGQITVNGGWPNGGAGGPSQAQAQWAPSPPCPQAQGGSGGGSSDIRIAPYAFANAVAIAGGGGGSGGDRIAGCGPGTGGGGGGGYYGGGGGGGYSGTPGTGGTQAAGGIAGTSPGCAIFGGGPGNNGVLGGGGLGGFAPGNNQAGPNTGCLGGCGGTLTGGTGVDCTGDNCPGLWSGGSGGGGSNHVTAAIIGPVQTACFQSGNGQVIITPNCALPIQLLNFNAEYVETSGTVQLRWSTGSETNNKLFTVEKSADGNKWQTVAIVPGAGNSSIALNYSAVDETPYAGLSYYRLGQTDFDGSETYSQIEPITIIANYELNLFPNPTKGDITLSYSTESTNPVNVMITDISGRVVMSYIESAVQLGSNNFKVHTSQLSKGMYYMKLSNAKKTFNLKFVVE
jgi:hypothetical protein